MLLNGQNIDPQQSIYRYTKSNHEVQDLPWTGAKIKINKNSKAYQTRLLKEKIKAMLRQGLSDIDISELTDTNLGYVRKIINSL